MVAMAAFTNMPVDLVIVRHGQSEANLMIEMFKRGDDSGQKAMHEAKRHDSDMRLTDLARQQAQMVGKWMNENGGVFDAFYCSQYVRTKETAAEMGLKHATWHADMMIRERDQGVQDGGGDVKMNLDDEEKFRSEKSPMYWQPIAGESMADVVTRVRHFLETLTQCSAGMRVVVVCRKRAAAPIPPAESPHPCTRTHTAHRSVSTRVSLTRRGPRTRCGRLPHDPRLPHPPRGDRTGGHSGAAQGAYAQLLHLVVLAARLRREARALAIRVREAHRGPARRDGGDHRA